MPHIVPRWPKGPVRYILHLAYPHAEWPAMQGPSQSEVRQLSVARTITNRPWPDSPPHLNNAHSHHQKRPAAPVNSHTKGTFMQPCCPGPSVNTCWLGRQMLAGCCRTPLHRLSIESASISQHPLPLTDTAPRQLAGCVYECSMCNLDYRSGCAADKLKNGVCGGKIHG